MKIDVKTAANIMLAYENGETIEYRLNDLHNKLCDWTPCPSPGWDWDHYLYRVAKKPELRPYSNAKEFLADMKLHGPLVKEKTLEYYRSIEIADFRDGTTKDGKSTDYLVTVSTVHEPFTMTEAMLNFVWADGAAFGIFK